MDTTALSCSTMAAVNAGAPSRPLPPRTRAGTAQAPPSLNPVHPSGHVQLIPMPVDSPPPVGGTCNVDVEPCSHLIRLGCVKGREDGNVWLGCVKGREEGNVMEQLQGHAGSGGPTPTPRKV